jgi:lysophospholipase L1-like esterase
MGGEGSVRKWREQDLAHTDFIHFTKAGYELQARLLLEALSSAYGDAD